MGNMSLFTQNMELDIPSNGGKIISNYIMCSSVLSPNDHNEVGVSLLNLWADYICIEKDYEL
jgi:hypothetical protein